MLLVVQRDADDALRRNAAFQQVAVEYMAALPKKIMANIKCNFILAIIHVGVNSLKILLKSSDYSVPVCLRQSQEFSALKLAAFDL